MFGTEGLASICCVANKQQTTGSMFAPPLPPPRSAQSASGNGAVQGILNSVQKLLGGSNSGVGTGYGLGLTVGSGADQAASGLQPVRWSKPFLDTRSPVPGINEWPNAGLGAPDDAFAGLGMNWEQLINSIAGAVPATISAAKGRPYYPQGTVVQSYPGNPTATPVEGAAAGTEAGQRVGGAVGNTFDQIGAWVGNHPYITLGVLGGAVLLFMNPPSRRR